MKRRVRPEGLTRVTESYPNPETVLNGLKRIAVASSGVPGLEGSRSPVRGECGTCNLDSETHMHHYERRSSHLIIIQIQYPFRYSEKVYQVTKACIGCS